MAACQYPPPPSRLLASSRAVWAAFWSSAAAASVDRRSDLPRLVRWIRAVDELERVWRQVRGERVVAGSTGQPVLHPLAAYVAQLDGMITRTEAEFGMTPAARRRQGLAVPVASEVDSVDQLRARRAARRAPAG